MTKNVGDKVFVVSYLSAVPDTLGTSYLSLAHYLPDQKEPTSFEIIELIVCEKSVATPKYTDLKIDCYILSDKDGEVWGCQFPMANVSDLGRSDHVYRKVAGEKPYSGVDILYHLTEHGVRNQAIGLNRHPAGKDNPVLLTALQRRLVADFHRVFPDWEIVVDENKEPIEASYPPDTWLSSAKFQIVKKHLFS